MNRFVKLAVMCGMGLLIVVGTITLLNLPGSWSQNAAAPLAIALANGGFEEPYADWQGSTERQIADQWSLWYLETGENYLDKPLANPASSPTHEGNTSQHIQSKSFRILNACVYQHVSNVTIGHYIQFSAWAMVQADNLLDSYEKWQVRLGIDPNGGSDPQQIEYYSYPFYWDTYNTDKGTWHKLSVSLKATASTATVYLCAHPTLPRDFNVYWDDAEVRVTSEQLVYVPLVVNQHCVIPPGELANPDLERQFCLVTDYQPHDGFSGAIAPYWNPFVNTTGDLKHPEYNKTDRDYRKYSGEVAQQFGHSAWGLFEAGIYQVVTGTNPGDVLQFSIYGWGWIGADGNTNDRVSDYTGADGLLMRVGIDPYGDEDANSANIVWSDFHSDPLDKWNQYQITATAAMTRASVWVYAKGNKWGMRYHQTFWDNADLSVIQPAP
ncbi:MAG: hypothetical protein JXA89_22125 [Anaerolineae bacterium]|nr:hypothetical protein [Anaerolineae bacterium]